jgi:manganese transport protein
MGARNRKGAFSKGRAHALFASCQSRVITGALSSQVVMEGSIRWRLALWVRRLLNRIRAIIPAVPPIGLGREGGSAGLPPLSQVVLAIHLALAMFPPLVFAG